MRTVKEVSDLTGISVRTLQYYDEIGLFKPTRLTASGYRMYDDAALEELQQILFFRELNFPLKHIKAIMENPGFDRVLAYHEQKQMLISRRDRLNELILLLEKLERGEKCMSFKEFDFTGYYEMLAQFKAQHREAVEKKWGSVEAFDQWVERYKEKEDILAGYIKESYGSMERYTEAIKQMLEKGPESSERVFELKENGFFDRNKALSDALLSDITRDFRSDAVQDIIAEMVDMTNQLYEGMDMGIDFWKRNYESYFDEKTISVIDKIYGEGASLFYGRAMKYYFEKDCADVKK